MKKVINISLVILLLMTVNLVYSGEVVSSSNQKRNENTKVEFEIVEKGSELSIKDEHGQTLYNVRVKQSGPFSKAFDLSNLPDAKYYFELNCDNRIKIIPFNVAERVATFIPNEEYTIAKPKIVVEDNYIHISNNMAKKQNMDVKIYYESNELAFTESLNDLQTIRTYDFSSSLRGYYTIVLETEGRTFVDNIQIP